MSDTIKGLWTPLRNFKQAKKRGRGRRPRKETLEHMMRGIRKKGTRSSRQRFKNIRKWDTMTLGHPGAMIPCPAGMTSGDLSDLTGTRGGGGSSVQEKEVREGKGGEEDREG